MISVNKRLDEWVTESWLDTRKVQFPRRDGAPNPGTTTPKKTHIGSGGGIMPSIISMCGLLFYSSFNKVIYCSKIKYF